MTIATRFADAGRALCLAILAAWVALTGACLVGARHLAAHPTTRAKPGESDIDLYDAIVTRLRHGASYYDAVDIEMHTRGFHVRPVWNFRLPTLAELLALLPEGNWALGLQCLLALVFVLMAHAWLRRSLGNRAALIGAALVFCSLAATTLHVFTMLHEAWAGLFVALSLGCFAYEGTWSRALGILLALLALSLRETTLPVCLIGLLFSLRERRRGEVVGWLIGLALLGALFALHVRAALPHIRPDDPARTWVAFSGPSLLVDMCRWNPLLWLAPLWVSALWLPLALLGLCGFRDPGGPRTALVVLVWVSAFAVVGLPVNHYWGALFAPLLPLGIVVAPFALRDLLQNASKGFLSKT